MTSHPWRFIVDHYLLLPIGGLIGLIWANSRPESYFAVSQAIAFPVNEVGMALFFALMTQEVVEATMPHGALHTWRKWTLPLAAAAGIVAASAAAHTAYVWWKYELVLAGGWPVAAAVDLAFAYFIVKAIFGRHPALSFLIVTAVAVDVVAILAVASRRAFVDVQPGGAALMLAAIGIAFALRQWKVRTFWPYLLVCGPLSWWALYTDGFLPALALVPIVLFVPHTPRRLDLFEDAPHGTHDSPMHFEHVFGHPIQAVLFLFGLANAGVLLSGYGTGTWALLTASLVAKPAGMLAATAIAVALGLHLPARLHWRDLVVVALATSGVFTTGLFIAIGAFPIGPVLAELKLGAVLTGIGAPLAFVAAWLLGAGRFHRHAHANVRRRAVAAGLAIVVLGAQAYAATQYPADDMLRRAVAQRLLDHDITGVEVTADRGAVTLRGTVPSMWARDRAIAEALKADERAVVLCELTIPRAESDEWLAGKVAESLRQYVFFSVFDDAEVEVNDGVVTLSGHVTMPYKADAFEDLAARVPGVQDITNEVRALPVSQFDDRLRYELARAVYDDPLFAHYAVLINPPVHIIVEHGRVTLTGVVFSEVERRKAEAIARSSLALSVVNRLRLEQED